MNTARSAMANAGTQTAALGAGGNPGTQVLTELYDGTSWTEVNDLNTGRRDFAGAGTQTSALAFGGNTGSFVAVTESWNGSNWTELGDLNTARV